jgi:hypothetical protein
MYLPNSINDADLQDGDLTMRTTASGSWATD